jgi:L-seryl-tRNA(Ser) seleniumtransferase
MHRMLSAPEIARYEADLGRDRVKSAVERVFDRVRASGDAAVTFDGLVATAAGDLERLRFRQLQRVINATGIIVHTNLGRAPLAAEALDAIVALGRGYSNLEYHLDCGERGSRYSQLSAAIAEATGAEDALVVNNGAAAVLLVLDSFAKGREVIVARSQLVEIGGGFRIPEVLERSGATLVEVGTTNRVYVEDFKRALSARTALILRTHPSNYRIEGFTHEADPKELVALGRRAGVLVAEDLGTGALEALSQFGVESERTVGDAIADGIGLVTFSGDKLLGGPQAGIIAGRSQLVARLRSNALLRALRVDKLTLAALDATLALHREDRERIPIYRMLATTLEELRERAMAYVSAIPRAAIVESSGYIGGGALPAKEIPSIAVALRADDADGLAASLRRATPPIVSRIESGRVLLDLRTISSEEDEIVIAAVRSAMPSSQ